MPFKPMLAKDGDPSKLTYPVIVQPKYDGIRASIVDGKLVSRTLKPIPNAAIRAVLERPEFEGLDGELIVGDPTAEDCYRRTSSFVMAPNKDDEPWAYYVFDKHDEPGGSFYRWSLAEIIVNSTTWTDLPLFMVPNTQVEDAAGLEAVEGKLVEAGHEGVIVRIPDDAYKFGRSGKKGPLLKIKRFVDFEAEVIGVYEELHNANEAKTNALGRTERSSHKAGKVGKGTLGGLILRTLPPSDPSNECLPEEGIEFRCGTGFDKEQRVLYWTESVGGTPGDTVVGRIAKVKSFPIGVKDKPRHPVFLGWREDGA